MISKSYLKNLKRDDRLILTSCVRSNPHHQKIFQAFNIGDVFLFTHYINDIEQIELKHSKSDRSYWISKNTFYECFDLIQTFRNDKINKILLLS